MLTGDMAPGLRPSFADGMVESVPDLVRHDLCGVGHWIHQEVPEVVNAHLVAWLVDPHPTVASPASPF